MRRLGDTCTRGRGRESGAPSVFYWYSSGGSQFSADTETRGPGSSDGAFVGGVSEKGLKGLR